MERALGYIRLMVMNSSVAETLYVKYYNIHHMRDCGFGFILFLLISSFSKNYINRKDYQLLLNQLDHNLQGFNFHVGDLN